jgi:hypothetical protein
MAKGKKKAIRAAAFGYQAEDDEAAIPFLDFEVIVKKPTIGEWGKLINQSSTMIGDGKGMEIKSDTTKRKILALTQFVYDEEGEHVFEKTDSDAIANAKVGSPIDRLADEVLELCDVDEDDLRGK